jgi:uncharacterized protein YkwD
MKKYIILCLLLALFGASFAAEPFSATVLERRIFSAVNAQRVKAGLAPLKTNLKLETIARAHSIDMAKRNYTSHVTPEGLDPSARAKKAGFNTVKKEGNVTRRGVGENIYETQSSLESEGVVTYYIADMDELVKKAVDGWMNSPGHRKNILNKDYTISGLGVAVSKDKKVKITQVFF